MASKAGCWEQFQDNTTVCIVADVTKHSTEQAEKDTWSCCFQIVYTAGEMAFYPENAIVVIDKPDTDIAR